MSLCVQYTVVMRLALLQAVAKPESVLCEAYCCNTDSYYQYAGCGALYATCSL
jgi:tagatose-1,6-bisphosphate aldolase non-catalytic subunit AgaZ/GatZ